MIVLIALATAVGAPFFTPELPFEQSKVVGEVFSCELQDTKALSFFELRGQQKPFVLDANKPVYRVDIWYGVVKMTRTKNKFPLFNDYSNVFSSLGKSFSVSDDRPRQVLISSESDTTKIVLTIEPAEAGGAWIGSKLVASSMRIMKPFTKNKMSFTNFIAGKCEYFSDKPYGDFLVKQQ